MEKGKRMEFKKAAKIVILAMVMLAITGITAIGIAAGAKETFVEFEDQGYTVRITFPNGEGIAHTESKSFVLRQAVPQIIYRILLYIKTMTVNQHKSKVHDTPRGNMNKNLNT